MTSYSYSDKLRIKAAALRAGGYDREQWAWMEQLALELEELARAVRGQCKGSDWTWEVAKQLTRPTAVAA